MSETTSKFHPIFLGYNMLSPQPVLMAGASFFDFSKQCVSHIIPTWKMHEINMPDFNWTKPDWLRKLPGREPKSSFWRKHKPKALGGKVLTGAFTYQLLKFCQITKALGDKENRRHHSLYFLSLYSFLMIMIIQYVFKCALKHIKGNLFIWEGLRKLWLHLEKCCIGCMYQVTNYIFYRWKIVWSNKQTPHWFQSITVFFTFGFYYW